MAHFDEGDHDSQRLQVKTREKYVKTVMSSQFVIEPLRSEQVAGAIKRIHECFADEPVGGSRQLNEEESAQIERDIMDLSIAHGISFVAKDTLLQGDEAIVGVRLSSVRLANGPHSLYVKENYPLRIQQLLTWKEWVVAAYVNEIQNGITKFMKLETLCVAPAYRRQGIAARLVERSLAAGRAAGCQEAIVVTAAPKSQQLFEKLDFRTAKIIDIRAYVDLPSNSRIFSEVPESGAFSKLMIKRL